ncbi:ABC-type antimicrobial peptide transport system, permease component [Fimbriiglobus ruber]|uniref:ABC-type antimicrobial peptide transport system, permease component n=2 Tax=Fimbriiglobus ruber TaxID=1908690 RepID=A0A225D838_9BACT|nr:ABC-type antimicrobial peptide transport system, permease component [Fimbriiglobus ruber]
MSYALQTLWHERSRYAAGVGAVAFSAVLIALQIGLLLGLFEITSIPVDHTTADIWVGSNGAPSVDIGRPIPTSLIARLDKPGVGMPEFLYLAFAEWKKSDGTSVNCVVEGSPVNPDSAACVTEITPEIRAALAEPMTVVVDRSDMSSDRLGLAGIGSRGKINGKEVRVVGIVSGLKSLAAPWIFCCQTTARELLGVNNPKYVDHSTYLLARCTTKERAAEVVSELRSEYPEMSAYTSEEFSTKTRVYWLLRTKAGLALGYAALLGLLVGSLITAQTLYSATMGSAKEFATLLALGIPRRKIYRMVLAQSFWVGVIGVSLAYPAVWTLSKLAEQAGTRVVLRWEILLGTAAVTLITAMIAGLFALRSVRQIEPMSLLR